MQLFMLWAVPIRCAHVHGRSRRYSSYEGYFTLRNDYSNGNQPAAEKFKILYVHADGANSPYKVK